MCTRCAAAAGMLMRAWPGMSTGPSVRRSRTSSAGPRSPVLAVVLVVGAGLVPVPVQHQAAGGGQDDARDQEDDAADPGRGVSVADGPRLVGGVRDVLAADGINGGVEGVQEEDDHQQRHADDGDARCRRSAPAGRNGPVPDGWPGRRRHPGRRPVSGSSAVRAAVCRAAVFHAVQPIGRAAPPLPELGLIPWLTHRRTRSPRS